MNKFLTVVGALAAVACVVLAGYYVRLEMGRWTPKQTELSIVSPDNPTLPVQLSEQEVRAVREVLDRYGKLIESVEIQIDGFRMNTLTSGEDSDQWAMFSLALRLADGTSVRSRVTKSARANVSQRMVDCVHRAMRAHAGAVRAGRPPGAVINI